MKRRITAVTATVLSLLCNVEQKDKNVRRPQIMAERREYKGVLAEEREGSRVQLERSEGSDESVEVEKRKSRVRRRGRRRSGWKEESAGVVECRRSRVQKEWSAGGVEWRRS